MLDFIFIFLQVAKSSYNRGQCGSQAEGDKNDMKNTSHNINKKSRRQNVYDLENTLAGAEGFEPSARGFGDIYQFRILIVLDKSSKYVMI